MVTPQTTVYITGRPPLRVVGARPRPPPGSSPHLISVLTNDGECFPVHRNLLRPCVALTKAVRAPGAGVKAPVDVDTCTFDRVLIFLEALLAGKESPSFGIHHVPDLQRAAEALQLSSLADWAAQRLGDATARCRWHSFDEIRRRNDAGECLLTMDGMVFDVTAWRFEHPGGSSIIGGQALNIDSSRFFELYHASRESFIYLREFYRGEVLHQDREAVPRPSVEPSDDFMKQLREWTVDCRLQDGGDGGDERAFKSF
jgi:cytochrome b involved in lipid metabolism